MGVIMQGSVMRIVLLAALVITCAPAVFARYQGGDPSWKPDCHNPKAAAPHHESEHGRPESGSDPHHGRDGSDSHGSGWAKPPSASFTKPPKASPPGAHFPRHFG